MQTPDTDLNDVLNKNLSDFNTWISESVPKIFNGLQIEDFRDVATAAAVVRDKEFIVLGTRTCEFNPGSISSIGDIATCNILNYIIEIERTASGVDVRITCKLPVVHTFHGYIVARTRHEPDDSRLTDAETSVLKIVSDIKKLVLLSEVQDVLNVYGLLEHYGDQVKNPDDKDVAITVCRDAIKSIDAGSVIAVAGSRADIDGCRLIDVSNVKGSGEEAVIVEVIRIICNLQKYSKNGTYAWKARN